MKKFSILAISLLAGATATVAQTSVVKDVEHQLKASNPNHAQALSTIKPALTNPETEGDMMAWYLAGKSAIGVYDDAFLAEQLGQTLSDDQKKAAGHAMIDGYNYYLKALHLDSIPNEKGKIKPRKAKEMLNQLSGHYNDYRTAGVFLFDTQDYDGAYDAWEIYVNMPNNPIFQGKAPAAAADTLVGQIIFYQGVAALSIDKNKEALEKMKAAIKSGYQNIYLYTYGAEAARRIEDKASLVELAQAGYDKYGTEDVSLVGQLINAKLEASDYPAAFELVSQAIEKTDPSNKAMIAQLYDIRGIIYEQDKKNDEAIADFTKATEIDDTFAKGYFDLGRMRFNAALEKSDQTNDALSQELKDQFLDAIKLFERAYQLDDSLSQIPATLYQAYWKLGAGYESEANYWKTVAGF